MKKLSIFVWVVILLVVMTSSAYARSGCCSHHGGVSSDGCGCNDGTSLSDTCAPYYSCTANSYYQAPIIQNTEIPIAVPTKVTPPTSTPLPTVSLTPLPRVNDLSTITSPVQVNVAGDNTSGNPIPGLFGLGVVGGLGYLAWRKIKNRGNKNSLPHDETTQK